MPVIDTDKGQMDVISRLLKDRILLLGQGVDDEVANVLVAQLLYLANEDPKKDITLYINSPGGSVSAGMAIYDSTCGRGPVRVLCPTSFRMVDIDLVVLSHYISL
jgi:ATP-dependent Clp protease, protease subunit